MLHLCYGNHCMLGQLRREVADETLSGEAFLQKTSKRGKKILLMESDQR